MRKRDERKVRRPNRPSIYAKTRKRLIRGAQLLAQGKTVRETAESLGVSTQQFSDFRREHPEVWALCQDEAMKLTREIIRANAGTDRVFEDPQTWLRMAARADKWATDRGEDLFEQVNGEMTLVQFYRDWYLTECMAPDSTDDYKQRFEQALRRWGWVTGDPPLEKITNETLQKYRDFLMRCRGLEPGSKLTPRSVRNALQYVLQVLRKAGPQGYRNDDAAGLLPRVPWVKMPRQQIKPPKIVSPEELSVVYQAADMMVMPQIAGVETGAWWRALLVVAYNTGLRRRTLFELEWRHLDAQTGRLHLPPERLKSRRGQLVYLNGPAMRHLESIRTDRDFIFEWPYTLDHFHEVFHRLQYDAGLPRAAHFGLHNIRKTTATALWQIAPQAAQLALGHAMDDVTRRHYVQGEAIVSAALDKLPQPEAFATSQ